LGHTTTAADVERAITVIGDAVDRLRAAAAGRSGVGAGTAP
jgi:hypothetical protein